LLRAARVVNRGLRIDFAFGGKPIVQFSAGLEIPLTRLLMSELGNSKMPLSCG
jgi:hypothetical protein